MNWLALEEKDESSAEVREDSEDHEVPDDFPVVGFNVVTCDTEVGEA